VRGAGRVDRRLGTRALVPGGEPDVRDHRRPARRRGAPGHVAGTFEVVLAPVSASGLDTLHTVPLSGSFDATPGPGAAPRRDVTAKKK